jgi:hypothetical protein
MMPSLPRYQAQIAAPDARLDPAVFAQSGNAMARAGLAVAEFGFDANRRFEEARAAQTLIREQAGLARELNDLRVKYDADPDWGTAPRRFEADANKLIETRRRALENDPRVLSMLERDFTRDFERERVGVVRGARTRQVEAGKADLETALGVYAEQAAREADLAMRAEIEGRARAAIAGSVAAGFVGQDDGVKREGAFKDRVREARILGLTRTDPDAAVRRLMDPADPDFAGMDPAARERALRQAQSASEGLTRQRNAEAERREREAERNLGRAGEALLKEAYATLDRDGTLPSDAIDRLRRHGGVSASEFRVIANAARNSGAAEDDTKTVVELTRQLHLLAPDDFERAASREALSGRLKIETFRSLVENNRRLARDDRPASPFRSGRELVANMLDPGSTFTGAAADRGKKAMGQALVEFDSWAEANPRASRSEALAEAQSIAARYETIKWSEMAQVVGLPRFHRGSREALDEAALDRAETETLRALEAGRLTPAQADQEARKIEVWRAARATQAARPASPPPRNNR